MDPKAQPHYPTDLTDRQWAHLAPLLPESGSTPGGRGRPRSTDLRQTLNGLFYLVKTGCPWRYLPRHYGPWQTLYDYFNRWSRAGIWRELMEEMNLAERRRQGRHEEPSAGCVDSQSVKTACQPRWNIGFDGFKRIKGRKRHILTDTLGLLLCVVVTAAHVDDRKGLRALMQCWFIRGVCRLRCLWADGVYESQALRQWLWSLKGTYNIRLHISRHRGAGFQVLPRRWVVERTFAWLGAYLSHPA